MKLELDNKTVFISGSTSGIGFSIAKRFLVEGAKVIINGRTEETVNKKLAELVEQYPAKNICGVALDFSDAHAVNAKMNELPEIDILINNVGIYTAQSFTQTSDDDWQRLFDVNVMSSVRLSRHVLTSMRNKNWGRIIFISSECAALVPEDLIAYSATKAAMLALSRGVAQSVKGSDITVNSVLPGSTLSEGAEQFLADQAQKNASTVAEEESNFFKNIRTSSLAQRFLEPKEIAAAVVFLSSPLAQGINGSAVKVDGGSIPGIF